MARWACAGPRPASRLGAAIGVLPTALTIVAPATARRRRPGEPHRARAAARSCAATRASRAARCSRSASADPRTSSAELRDRRGRVVSSARFTHGPRRALALRRGGARSLRRALRRRTVARRGRDVRGDVARSGGRASRRTGGGRWRGRSPARCRSRAPWRCPRPLPPPHDAPPRPALRGSAAAAVSPPPVQARAAAARCAPSRSASSPTAATGRSTTASTPARRSRRRRAASPSTCRRRPRAGRSQQRARRLRPRRRPRPDAPRQRRARRRGRQRHEPRRHRSAPTAASWPSSPPRRTSSPATTTACATSSCATCAAGTTRLLAPGRSPALSGDGRYVAYEGAGGVDVAAVADRHDPARWSRTPTAPRSARDGALRRATSRARARQHDTNHNWDVFRIDRSDRRHHAAQRSGRRAQPPRPEPVGRAERRRLVAAFQSDAPLLNGDRTGLRDVFVRDVNARRTVLVSANRCGRPANGYSRYPSISADGRRVAFDSHATDLVAGRAARSRPGLPARPRAHRTRLLSATRAGRASARTSFSPALAAARDDRRLPLLRLRPRPARHEPARRHLPAHRREGSHAAAQPAVRSERSFARETWGLQTRVRVVR